MLQGSAGLQSGTMPDGGRAYPESRGSEPDLQIVLIPALAHHRPGVLRGARLFDKVDGA